MSAVKKIWLKNFEIVRKYRESHGKLPAKEYSDPDTGWAVGLWCFELQKQLKKDDLPRWQKQYALQIIGVEARETRKKYQQEQKRIRREARLLRQQEQKKQRQEKAKQKKLLEKEKKRRSFAEWKDLCEKYIQKNVGANPERDTWKTEEEHKLSKWLIEQRKKYKQGKLTSEQVKQLESIGVYWKYRIELDVVFFKLFRTYALKNDGKNPSVRYECPRTLKALGNWTSRMRGKYYANELSPRAVSQLESAGIIWYPQDQVFEDSCKIIQDFARKYRGANPPESYRDPKTNRCIGAWLERLREKKRARTLSQDQIKMAEQAGIIWNGGLARYRLHCAMMRVYQEQHFDGSPTQYYREPICNLELGKWYAEQLLLFQKGHLPKKQKLIAEEVGMKWL